MRAEVRRKSIIRAAARHRQAVQRSADPYPTALVVAQRLGVVLEDLGRLTLALESLGGGDPFRALRDGRLNELDRLFRRLADDPERFRVAVRLPTPETTEDLPADQREALLAASDALARRWHAQWRRCSAGWLLLRHLAKAIRHGAPMLPRELVLGPPGAGALGEGLGDPYDRWVLLVETEVDPGAAAIRTEYAIADISDGTLSRARQAGLEAIALARELAALHVHRVRSQSKWALPAEALKLVSREHRRVLSKARR